LGRRLPTKESNMLVGVSRGCRTKVGVVDNLLSVHSKDFVCHGMSNILSNANHMTKCLMRFRREIGVINLVVDLFPKMKMEEGTNIHSRASSILQRDTINGCTVGVVQEKADIEEAK